MTTTSSVGRTEPALPIHTTRFDALYAATLDIARELTLPLLLQLITRRAVELIGAAAGTLFRWDPAAQVLTPAAGPSAGDWRATSRLRLGEGVTGAAAARRAGLLVNDYRASPYAHPDGLHQAGLAAVLAEPLVHHERLVGVLTLDRPGNMGRFTDEDQALLRLFTAHAAIAIENARLHAAVLQRAEQFATLNTLAQTLMAELDPAQAVQTILATVQVLFPGTVGHVWEELREVSGLRLTATTAPAQPGAPFTGYLEAGEGLAGCALAAGQPVMSRNVATDPRWRNRAWAAAEGLVSAIAVPLAHRHAARGALILLTRTAHDFDADEVALLQLFGTHAAIALENARLFAELHDSYARLQAVQAELIQTEKLRALGQLAAGVAHDLNNTLAAILGQVEFLKLQAPPPAIGEGLALLGMAAADGAQVVRRLQDFGRQRSTAPLQSCALVPIVQEALELTRPRWTDEAQRQGQRIVVQTFLDGLSPILGHPSEIREALTNLIFNAVDAMPNGGTLTMAGAPSPEGVILRVTDTGVGMTAEVQARLFEPFFTTKGVQGTGLGLSVVYGILERHGGHIDVTSAPGQGTTVTLRFRRAEGGIPAAAPPPSAPPEPRRLLLIDDDALLRASLGDLLRAVGHTVVIADSGSAGLACLAETAADCVITDLGMPEMTGWEVARAVKARHPYLPVVVLTGWGEQVEQERAMEERRSVDRILGKPVHLRDLLAVIAELTPPRAT